MIIHGCMFQADLLQRKNKFYFKLEKKILYLSRAKILQHITHVTSHVLRQTQPYYQEAASKYVVDLEVKQVCSSFLNTYVHTLQTIIRIQGLSGITYEELKQHFSHLDPFGSAAAFTVKGRAISSGIPQRNPVVFLPPYLPQGSLGLGLNL